MHRHRVYLVHYSQLKKASQNVSGSDIPSLAFFVCLFCFSFFFSLSFRCIFAVMSASNYLSFIDKTLTKKECVGVDV